MNEPGKGAATEGKRTGIFKGTEAWKQGGCSVQLECSGSDTGNWCFHRQSCINTAVTLAVRLLLLCPLNIATTGLSNERFIFTFSRVSDLNLDLFNYKSWELKKNHLIVFCLLLINSYKGYFKCVARLPIRIIIQGIILTKQSLVFSTN